MEKKNSVHYCIEVEENSLKKRIKKSKTKRKRLEKKDRENATENMQKPPQCK
jgi:hypothetical protein